MPRSQSEPIRQPEAAIEEMEVLIADARAGLTPAEMVERKLLDLLKGTAVPLSQIRLMGLRRGRGLG
jgi:hypothetical protein